MTKRPDRLLHPNKPYTTGEIAELCGVTTRTVNRWIEAGKFGAKDTDWWWTAGGEQKGDRRVSAPAVRRYLRDRGDG